MRAREFISEYVIPSRPVTLRSLNLLNRQKRKRDTDYEWRTRVLMTAMYGLDHPNDVESERRELDLDRREIALDKRDAELDLIRIRSVRSGRRALTWAESGVLCSHVIPAALTSAGLADSGARCDNRDYPSKN